MVVYVVGAVLVLVVLFAVWMIGMRTKNRVVIDFQRRVNRRFINRWQMRKAGAPGAYAGILHHVGRRSGRAYQTPVVPLPTADGYVIVLPYGSRSDWVRNVVAAGSARFVLEGETFDVDSPEVVGVDGAGYDFSPKEQRELRRFGNTECLRVRRVAG